MVNTYFVGFGSENIIDSYYKFGSIKTDEFTVPVNSIRSRKAERLV